MGIFGGRMSGKSYFNDDDSESALEYYYLVDKIMAAVEHKLFILAFKNEREPKQAKQKKWRRRK